MGYKEDLDIATVIWRLSNLEYNFERVGYMHLLKHIAYRKGFDDATLLREFCDDYTPEPYFPTGDSRPRAERLAWQSTT